MLKSEPSEGGWHESRPQGMCSTCLAVDRRLFSLQNTPQFFNIFIGLALPEMGMICFECRSRLNGFLKFRTRVQQAHKMLSGLPHTGTPLAKISQYFSATGVPCLSTLTRTFLSPHDSIHIDGDPSVDIKLEMDPDVRVKEESPEHFLTVKPIMDSSYAAVGGLKTEGYGSNEEESGDELKGEPSEDDKSDTASESGEVEPQKDGTTLIVTQIGRGEALAYLERERGTPRYQRAPYKCDQCAVPFRLEQKFKCHQKLHSEERGPLKCEICELRFNDRGILKLHTESHHRQYGCPQCPRVDCSYIKMHSHYKKVHDETTPRACRKCPARFTSAKDLRAHVRSSHEHHSCPLCGRRYTAKPSLERHLVSAHTKLRQLECQICHRKYKGEANLKVHVRKVHQKPRKEAPGDNAYCAECNVHFCDAYSYRTHLRTSRHVLGDDFKHWCDHCGKRYTQKMSLIVHIEEQHLKLSRYKCEFCDERFHSNFSRHRHVRTKHRDRPRKHVCEFCAKAFVIRKSLEDHKNTHLGVRPYECKSCGATFAYSAALYNHTMLVHLKKKRRSKTTVEPSR